MKKLWILLAIMGVSTYLLLSDNDTNKKKKEHHQLKKKFKKSHFPKGDVAAT